MLFTVIQYLTNDHHSFLTVELGWWGKLDNEHLIIIIAIVVGAILMVLIVCIIIIIVCRRKRAEDKCK